VVFDASIVRGLAYYTGVVFEAFDAAGELRALCGGGRYDRLVESLGGKPLPAAGFGFGDAVICELLEARGLLPALARSLDDVVVALASASARGLGPERAAAIRLAARLRGEGGAVALVLDAPLKRALRNADRAGAARVHRSARTSSVASREGARPASGEERDEPPPERPRKDGGSRTARGRTLYVRASSEPELGQTVRSNTPRPAVASREGPPCAHGPSATVSSFQRPELGRGFFSVNERGYVEVRPRVPTARRSICSRWCRT
jgi:hypothetical protein